MRTLDLEIKLSGKKYVVTVERSIHLELGSKTYAKKWINKYKKLIIDHVNLINLYLPKVYNLYRLHYFSINAIQTNQINEHFNIMHDRFDYIYKSFSEGNKNVFTFSNIDKVLANLIDVTVLLKSIGQKHKINALKHNCNAILLLLTTIEESYYDKKQKLRIEDRYRKLTTLQIVGNDNNSLKTATQT